MKKLRILLLVLFSALVPAQAQNTNLLPIKSSAAEASHVFSAVPARLCSFDITSHKSSEQWILIMDASSLPADGTVKLLYPPIYLSANGTASRDFLIPYRAVTGIVICNSSTALSGTTYTKTLGSADCSFSVQVVSP